jgi:hypothetical protein
LWEVWGEKRLALLLLGLRLLHAHLRLNQIREWDAGLLVCLELGHLQGIEWLVAKHARLLKNDLALRKLDKLWLLLVRKPCQSANGLGCCGSTSTMTRLERLIADVLVHLVHLVHLERDLRLIVVQRCLGVRVAPVGLEVARPAATVAATT